jgi:hypothetical protein
LRIACGPLGWRERLDCERVNLVAHFVRERSVNQTMPLRQGTTMKPLGDDAHPEMSFALFGPGMASVLCAFVLDFEHLGL